MKMILSDENLLIHILRERCTTVTVEASPILFLLLSLSPMFLHGTHITFKLVRVFKHLCKGNKGKSVR